MLIGKKNFLIFVLILVGFSVYAFNLNNSLFWDDDEWIKNNPFVHDFSYLKEIFTENILSGFGLKSNYYRPVLSISFALNYVIHGIQPVGYHLLSNGIHIANGVLIFLLLGHVLKRRLLAFLVATLFIIHPLQTEAVTYISGRGDLLSVFFMLLALWLFIKSQFTTSQVVNYNLRCRKRYLWINASLLSMIVAVLSRETAVLFPALLMIFFIAFLSVEGFWRSFKTSFVKAIPFLLVSVTYMILRLTVFNFKNTLNFYSEANDYTAHLSYRLFTFGYALVEYFKLIFVPLGLHMERDLQLKTSLFQWPVWLALVIVLAVIWWGMRLYRKSQGQSLDFKVWFFGWSWFFIGLSPVSGIIPINAVMYEHWLYLPLIGFFTVVVWYLVKLLDFSKALKSAYCVLSAVIIGYLLFFGVASVQRNMIWGNPIRFYEDILTYNPRSVRILTNLGNLYSEKGDIEKARSLYEEALRIPKGNSFPQLYYNLGNIYRNRKDIAKAVEYYQKAIKIDPSFPFAYQNLAIIYADQGNFEKAAAMLEKVKVLRPGESRVYYNLGLIYLAQKKDDLARINLESGLKYVSRDPEAKRQISDLLEKIR